MAFTIIERSVGGQVTVINTDQITYLRQDAYGTSIHFTSGEHVNCPMEMDTLLETLKGNAPETLLIRQS